LQRFSQTGDKEDEMRLTVTSTSAALAFSFALAVPISAYAAGAASVHKQTRHVAHVEISRNASALAPAWVMSVVGRLPETDGLSRNRDDCNYGCIDN
jgi:hypothetical protein